MKNLFLLTIILSLLGALSRDNSTYGQAFLIALFLAFVLFALAYLFHRYYQKNSLGIYCLIFFNTWKLNRQVERNKKYIEKLKKKITRIRQKLFDVDSTSRL